MPKVKRIASVVAVAGLVSVASIGAANAADPKTKGPAEAAAVNARLLQTEMMVAALACDLRPSYNRAMRTFQTELVGHGKVLRSVFRRNHGASAQRHLDKYITALANDASSRSNFDRISYCQTAATLFDDVLSSPSAGFDQMTKKLIQEAALPIQSR
ncbi:MAG: hypothetical protein GKS02_06100 [Alphaproteobacteria bacterium]|nr:hypothetical protein [Alphaproteobacteria bacterium]